MVNINGSRLKLRDWQVDDLATLGEWLQPGHQ